MISSRLFALLAAMLPCTSLVVAAQTAVAGTETVVVDGKAPTTPFPHFWERTFGSGRAILSLRQSYRDDLRTVKEATNFDSIRFHGILMDEVGLYDPDRRSVAFAQMKTSERAADSGLYNFSYVDQIYDGLLASGVRPFVELSFMPKKMASDPNQLHPFWYHPDNSPPKSYDDWDAMIRAFAQHLVDRYGIDEVATWKFEVWNEPNIDFWAGNPKQATYFELYDHTARAIKAVSSRLQVGGPATAQAAWVTPFIAHVHEEIVASAMPQLPLIFSEYNASYANEPNVTDDPYMGPWLANTIRLCDGLTQSMDYWAFSDVFEEQGVVRTPFYGGFGLIAADNIPKATLNIFRALHMLGDQRIAIASESALATRKADGSLAVALWDYAPPTGTGAGYTMPSGPAGPAKTFDLEIDGVKRDAEVAVWRVDDDHGNVLKAFNAMGRPAGDLTPAQIKTLQAAGQMAPAERMHLHGGHVTITVPAHGLAVLTLAR